MRFDIITLFPEMFAALNYGITGRAINKDILQLHYWNPRDYTQDKQRRIDDRPYGGGPGMVMLAQPLHDTIYAIKKTNPGKLIHLTPQGKLLQQYQINTLAQQDNLIFLAGRYEGIDARIITAAVDAELSIGDYVLSGGELAAMVVIDAIARLLPGALGHEDSALQDSFMQALLDCPHYTRPKIFNGQKVPNVLLSGNHEQIARWRLQQALGRTYLRRPDLLKKRKLTADEQQLLTEFINEQKEVSHE
jgi:tRNA (guanine37-N1)-methyltransferase